MREIFRIPVVLLAALVASSGVAAAQGANIVSDANAEAGTQVDEGFMSWLSVRWSTAVDTVGGALGLDGGADAALSGEGVSVASDASASGALEEDAAELSLVARLRAVIGL